MLSRKSSFVALTLSVLLILTLQYAIDHSAKALPQLLQLIAYGSLPFAGGLITLSFCSLLRTFVDVENWATSSIVRLVLEEQTSYFLVGFIIVAYFSLIRRPLAASAPFLPYVEWVAVALMVYAIYTVTRQSTEKSCVSLEDPGWKEHVQKVKREPGRDLVRLTSVMKQFVDDGVKGPLLVYLTSHLQRLGETEEEILKTLSPLLDYQEDARRHGLYFLVFPWKKGEPAKRNQKARENLLGTLLEKTIGLDENES